MQITLTGLTHIRCIDWFVSGSIIAWLTFVAINAFGVVLTVKANASSAILAIHVKTKTLSFDLFIEEAFIGVVETVALLADIRIVDNGSPPLVLLITATAFLALRAARVVLTTARHAVRIARIYLVALGCVTIAHAPATNIDVLDAIEVLAKQ